MLILIKEYLPSYYLVQNDELFNILIKQVFELKQGHVRGCYSTIIKIIEAHSLYSGEQSRIVINVKEFGFFDQTKFIIWCNMNYVMILLWTVYRIRY